MVAGDGGDCVAAADGGGGGGGGGGYTGNIGHLVFVLPVTFLNF